MNDAYTEATNFSVVDTTPTTPATMDALMTGISAIANSDEKEEFLNAFFRDNATTLASNPAYITAVITYLEWTEKLITPQSLLVETPTVIMIGSDIVIEAINPDSAVLTQLLIEDIDATLFNLEPSNQDYPSRSLHYIIKTTHSNYSPPLTLNELASYLCGVLYCNRPITFSNLNYSKLS